MGSSINDLARGLGSPGSNAPGISPALIVLFSVLGAALIIFALIRGFRSSEWGKFHRLGIEYGLEKFQYRILKRAAKLQKIANPTSLYTNSKSLNQLLKSLIVDINSMKITQGEKDKHISDVLGIKQRIAAYNPKTKQRFSTKTIPSNQQVEIHSKIWPPFTSEVTGKISDTLALRLPHDRSGDYVKYKVGEIIRVRYAKDEGKLYTFTTRINDIREIDGEMKLLLQHVDNVHLVQLRKSPRKEIQRNAYFYKVQIVTEGRGRKKVRKAAIDKTKRTSGTIVDLSAGGCGILTRAPLPKDSLVMIAFEVITGQTINVFGKVRGIRKEQRGSLMHVMFTRVSTRHLNDIRSYIFGFLDHDEPARGKNSILLH